MERGIAAFLAVAFHARGHLLKAFGSSPLTNALAFAYVGVDFFFVLSGFVIPHAHAADIGQPIMLGRYLRRRVTRVIPFYWVALTASLIVMAVTHPLPPLGRLAASALLLPLPGDLALPVAWSLQHEIVFYALFATLIISRDLGLMLLGGWLALIVCGILGAGGDPTGIASRRDPGDAWARRLLAAAGRPARVVPGPVGGAVVNRLPIADERLPWLEDGGRAEALRPTGRGVEA